MNDNILGCFLKVGFDPNLSGQEFMDLANTFRVYIWGEKGICDTLKKLKHEDYGKDLILVLFQFYVKLSIENSCHMYLIMKLKI